MTYLQRLLEALESRVWKFVRIVHSTNHEYPYHDYKELVNEDEENSAIFHYVCGEGNVAAHGDQHKYFVSKRMLIWAMHPETYVQLNDSKNVAINIPLKFYDFTALQGVAEIELHTNINEIFVTVPAAKTVYVYCEGVLPEEARDAE